MKLDAIHMRDPYILPFNNKYYLYGTTDENIWSGAGGGFMCYESSDLTDWVNPQTVFTPPGGFWGTRNFWAPEVFFYDGAFYMFASFIGDGFLRGTAALKSANPTGPFAPHSDGALTPKDKMCLDGTFYSDDYPYIIYCHEWVQTGDGAVYAARLSADLSKITGEPALLFKSSAAPFSKKMFSPSNNIEGFVTDGPFLFKNASGKLFMLWSCFCDGGYCQAQAVSPSGRVTGPWQVLPEPVYKNDGGHGMLFKTFDGQTKLTLHQPNKTPSERPLILNARITENGAALS